MSIVPAGKGENIWDHLVHNYPYFISDMSNGDVACDSYHRYLEDIELLKDLKVNFYRFSISWARILPNGLTNSYNEKGIEYYGKVIDELVKNGITPMVTLFHWDLPQHLQQIGGWANPKIVKYFTEYARIIFDKFADRVPIWTTFNEPAQVCKQGYGGTDKAPVLNSNGLADYQCNHNLLKSHASVYHLYDNNYRSKYNGKIGIVIDGGYLFPETDTEANLAAQHRGFQFGVTHQTPPNSALKCHLSVRSLRSPHLPRRLPPNHDRPNRGSQRQGGLPKVPSAHLHPGRGRLRKGYFGLLRPEPLLLRHG